MSTDPDDPADPEDPEGFALDFTPAGERANRQLLSALAAAASLWAAGGEEVLVFRTRRQGSISRPVVLTVAPDLAAKAVALAAALQEMQAALRRALGVPADDPESGAPASPSDTPTKEIP